MSAVSYQRIIIDVLRNKNKMIIKNIRNNKYLDDYIIGLHIFILFGTVIYGIVSGFFVGGYQIFINSIKIPIVIFGIIYISLPVFYFFNLFIEGRLGLKQITIILLAGFSITAAILIAFSPVIFLFSITTVNSQFIVLLNTSVGAMALFCGLILIHQLYQRIYGNSRDHASLIIGYFIIFFSGSQLIWVMRPYLHQIDAFVEPIKSNFFIEISKVMIKEPIIAGILGIIFSAVAFLIIYNLYFNAQIMPIRFFKPPQDAKIISQTEIKGKNKLGIDKKISKTTCPFYPYYYPYYVYDDPYVKKIKKTDTK